MYMYMHESQKLPVWVIIGIWKRLTWAMSAIDSIFLPCTCIKLCPCTCRYGNLGQAKFCITGVVEWCHLLSLLLSGAMNLQHFSPLKGKSVHFHVHVHVYLWRQYMSMCVQCKLYLDPFVHVSWLLDKCNSPENWSAYMYLFHLIFLCLALCCREIIPFSEVDWPTSN